MNWCWKWQEELPAWKQPWLVLTSISPRDVELQFLLGWRLGKTIFRATLAASVANKDFVFLTWATLSGNRGNCKASLMYLGKSVNVINSDSAKARLIEMVRKA